MVRRKKWSFLWILIPVLIVGILGLLFVPYFLDPILHKKILQESLATTLGRNITIGQAKISLWGGIGITFEDFRVKDRSQKFDLLQSKRLILKAKFLPLLRRKIKWKRVVLDGPVFRLHRDEKGHFNIADASLTQEELKTSQQKMLQTLSTLFGGSLDLRNGKITFTDETLGGPPLVTEITSFNLFFSEVAYPQPFSFHISGRIDHPIERSHFSASGTLRNISEEMDFSRGTIAGKVEIKGIDTAHFWPYLKTLLPMQKISGILDLNGHYQVDFSGRFKASAKLRLRDVVFDYPQVFAHVLTPKWVNLDLEVDYHLKEIKVPRILLELPEIKVKARGKIDGIGSDEMDLEAEAQSDPFDLSEAKRLIPYRIITPDVSDHLFRGEGRGPVQIISVKLSGKMPEIEHCDQLQHAHTLSVEMKLDKVRLKLPWDLPPLEDLQGNLLFEKGDLSLKEVDGRIFHSRINQANGIFLQLLQVPTLQVSCKGQLDLMDLSSFAKIKGFSDGLPKILLSLDILSGKADYRLTARGDLKPPLSFQYPTIHSTHSPFSYEGELMPKGATLLLRGASSPLTIRDGSLSFSNLGVNFLKMKVQTGNSFLTLDGSVKEGNVQLSTNGSIDLNFLPSLLRSPFFPDQVRSSLDGIQELAGEAVVRMRWIGRAEDWIASLKQGEIRLRRVSLRYHGISFPFSFIEGSLFLSPEQFWFEGKGRLGDSQLMASGGFPRSQSLMPGGRRWLSFQISSPDLDLDLLFPKMKEDTTTSLKKIKDWLSYWSIDGKVEAARVRYHGILCQDLKTEMKTIDGKLFFHPFQLKGAGGDLWGEGWIAPTERGIRFEINPRLSNMETEAFLRAFLQKGIEEKVEVTGRIHIDKVALKGEGEDFQRVKGSLNGSLRIEMENGVIERFNILSKIFSILNVSQLFKGRLPDLKTKGLPYHQIIANIDVKDGIASTDDLVVDSDAMKITLIGKFDLGKNLVDAKIGIHPLVTIDTVLSNVPIAGYILTGKDKAFLAYVYEVKGDLNNPRIEAIPLKSMGEGFWGIIKRLLETPLRPFQKNSK
jgi:uncharacterized protein YhdP